MTSLRQKRSNEESYSFILNINIIFPTFFFVRMKGGLRSKDIIPKLIFCVEFRQISGVNGKTFI